MKLNITIFSLKVTVRCSVFLLILFLCLQFWGHFHWCLFWNSLLQKRRKTEQVGMCQVYQSFHEQPSKSESWGQIFPSGVKLLFLFLPFVISNTNYVVLFRKRNLYSKLNVLIYLIISNWNNLITFDLWSLCHESCSLWAYSVEFVASLVMRVLEKYM